MGAPNTPHPYADTKDRSNDSVKAKAERLHLKRISPSYWRVTFDHPPVEYFRTGNNPGVGSGRRRHRKQSRSEGRCLSTAPVEGFFITHYDFLAEGKSFSPGKTGLQPLPDMLARLSRAPVASIASHPRTRYWRRQRTCSRPATCASQASKKLSYHSGRSAPAWCQAVDQWLDCPDSSGADAR